MAALSDRDRAKLPNSAFAYVNSRGERKLPIHDEAHVRNALARFNRVVFEDEAARERARNRLLKAAKKYGIVPVGFITGQLRAEGRRGPPLPTGSVTFLLTDIEGSTGLLTKLGDRYGDLLRDVRHIVRQAVVRAGGREVDARADEFFAVFQVPSQAIDAAVALQRALGERTWPRRVECRVRVGIHTGRPTLTDGGYIGLSVHTAARVCGIAHGGQIVVSGKTRTAARGGLPAGVRLRSLGRHRLPGLSTAEALFQVEADGILGGFPALSIEPARTKASARGG
jgi:class 3 adenylate cyclase